MTLGPDLCISLSAPLLSLIVWHNELFFSSKYELKQKQDIGLQANLQILISKLNFN